MRNKKIYLSVIVPVFNEKERLENISKIDIFLKKQKFKSELIIVDDGSNQESKKLLKKTKNKYGFKLISYTKNMGKGYAVKKGVLSSTGTYILFLDIDLSTPIEECSKFFKKNDNIVVIGSRRIFGSKLLTRQKRSREIMGSFFTLLSQKFLCLNISDFTCGFKYFHGKAAKNIFLKTTINRWGFDPEILFLAKKLGYKITEVPITWKDDPHTRVKFPQDVFRSLFELFKIRVNDFFGIYRQEKKTL